MPVRRKAERTTDGHSYRMPIACGAFFHKGTSSTASHFVTEADRALPARTMVPPSPCYGGKAFICGFSPFRMEKVREAVMRGYQNPSILRKENLPEPVRRTDFTPAGHFTGTAYFTCRRQISPRRLRRVFSQGILIRRLRRRITLRFASFQRCRRASGRASPSLPHRRGRQIYEASPPSGWRSSAKR